MVTKLYEIVVTGTHVTITPDVHDLGIDDQVQWSIDDGTGTVTFVSRGVVDFLNDIVTPESRAAGIAMIPGEHKFAVNVWLRGQIKTVYGTLIIT